jgi:drug/metabolite transporter (DMT)-like permease
MALSDNLRGALYMNAAMAAFAVSDAAMKVLLTHVPLFQAIALRGVLTILGLAVLVKIMGGGQFTVPRGDRAAVALRSLFEFLAAVTFIGALSQMPLPTLSAIMQSVPLAVTLAAALVFGERIGWRRLTAIGVGACGVLLIIRPGTAGFDVWSLLALACVATVVVRDMATRKIGRGVPSVTVAFWSAVTVTALCSLIAPLQDVVVPTLRDAGLMLFCAVLLIVGYITVVSGSRIGEVGFVAPHRYSTLVWTLALGWIVFGFWPDALTLTGAAIVVGSGLFTIWRESRLRAKPLAGRVDIASDSA